MELTYTEVRDIFMQYNIPINRTGIEFVANTLNSTSLTKERKMPIVHRIAEKLLTEYIIQTMMK